MQSLDFYAFAAKESIIMEKHNSTYRMVFTALMAAIVCLMTFIRIPFLGSKVHLANAMCLLSGLLLGGGLGGLAAGLGSGLYDILWGGYDIIQCLITFVSKLLMAVLCAMIARNVKNSPSKGRVIAACICGAFFYVLLYMLKTFIYQRFVYAYPIETVWVTMLSKLPASLINAAVSSVITPIIYFAIKPVFDRAGYTEKLNKQ